MLQPSPLPSRSEGPAEGQEHILSLMHSFRVPCEILFNYDLYNYIDPDWFGFEKLLNTSLTSTLSLMLTICNKSLSCKLFM